MSNDNVTKKIQGPVSGTNESYNGRDQSLQDSYQGHNKDSYQGANNQGQNNTFTTPQISRVPPDAVIQNFNTPNISRTPATQPVNSNQTNTNTTTNKK